MYPFAFLPDFSLTSSNFHPVFLKFMEFVIDNFPTAVVY